MAKRKDDGLGWGARSDKQPSMSILDPHVRLGFAVVKQAVADLQKTDELAAFDALCWWLEGAEDWLIMLKLYPPEDGRYFARLIEGCTNGKR